MANKDSNETNFAVNDIVSWTVTATDDVDVDDLIAFDCFEVIVMFVAGGDPDIDTDVAVRCVLVEYI